MSGDAVELQFEMFALVRSIELEMAAVETDTARPIALRTVLRSIERSLDHPVVWQVELAPAGVIEARGGRTIGVAGLGQTIGIVVILRDGKRDVTLMESPTAV